MVDVFIRKIMAKFIELTQQGESIYNEVIDRKIRVNVEQINFYYDKHIVLTRRAIDVLESYDEITKLLEKQQ